jgi:hypothetical protein
MMQTLVCWNSGSDKILEPDGIKDFWTDVKVDFLKFMQYSHLNGILVNGMNSNFIVLIPKVDNPHTIGYFRPISLVGCVYKVLSEVLANCLKKVIRKVVSDNQSAFVCER